MNSVLGIDLSNYQKGEWTGLDGNKYWRYFDPVEAKKKSIQFAFIKASEGLLKDKSVDIHAEAFSDAGIPFGFYHFGRNEWSYQPQVDNFYNIIKDYDYDLPPVLDFERHPNGSAPGLSFCQAFLGRIGSKTGKSPIIYTGPSFWASLIGSTKATWAKEYKVWMANYYKTTSRPELNFPVRGIPDIVQNATSMPSLPAPFEKWTFWQFTDKGDGEYYGGNYDVRVNKTGLDLNVYNGELVDLYAEFAIGQEAPEDPPVPVYTHVEIGDCFRPSGGWLFVHNKADLNDGAQLAIGTGEILELVEPNIIQADIKYWHIKTKDGFVGYVSAQSERFTKPC